MLVLASSTSIMSTDMYSPSLPDLTTWFETTPTRVKLTISLNILAFGLAQLFHGPLSDRLGRRPVILVSLLLVAVFSLACAFAETIDQLIVARVLLGTVAAAEAVVGLAILKDLYTEKQQGKALALLGMVIAITPAAAPILGGYLHVRYGWQSNFYVISAMALLSFVIIWRLLPESTIPDPKALNFRRVVSGYSRLIVNRDFMVHTSMLGVAMGLVFVFVTAAPFVLIDMLGVAVDRFGFYQAGIVLAFFLGSVLASRLADHWDALRLFGFGVSLVIVGAVALIGVIMLDVLSPMRMIVCYMIITFGMGPLFAVAPSRALRSVEGQAGTASALLSGIEQTMAGVAALLVSVLHDGTARPMAWVTIVLAFSLLLMMRWSRLIDRQRISPSGQY